MKVLCAFSQYNYGVKVRGTSIEYEAFVPAIRNLGHDVLFVDTWDNETFPDYGSLNRTLLQKARQFLPDLVFTVHRDYEIWTETLLAIANECPAAIATWTTDDSFKFFKVSRFIGGYYDAISTTYDYRLADYKAAGIKSACFTQWAANAHWMNPPKPASECRYKVSFIGTRYGERAEIVNQLRESGIEVECFGYGWRSGPIETAQIPFIMRDSIISLNFSAGFISSGGHDRQIKARTFEVPGAGGFLLTDAAPGLENVYRIGGEIEVFHGLEELKSKIRFYLEHLEERDRIAMAGYERTRTCHTYEKRLKEIFDFALQRRDMRRYSFPASHASAGNAVPSSQNKSDAPVYGVNLLQRAARQILVRGCRLVWGRDRGLRAARRITSELCVRIMGARTFTAKGLPGRLFPYV
ncbi:MAG TPA: glycosyltransferase [Candidatus Angelobacter sp.]|nr:glycosyltransferase [Candidatus Angelobacter sp.]